MQGWPSCSHVFPLIERWEFEPKPLRSYVSKKIIMENNLHSSEFLKISLVVYEACQPIKLWWKIIKSSQSMSREGRRVETNINPQLTWFQTKLKFVLKSNNFKINKWSAKGLKGQIKLHSPSVSKHQVQVKFLNKLTWLLKPVTSKLR